jgi:hypothetical protein
MSRKGKGEVVVIDRRDGISPQEASQAGSVLREWRDRREESPVVPAAETGAEYLITDWRGHPNYQCTRCSYATLRLASIQAHIQIHGG